jgi:formate dehydrogenase subunit gamma
MFKTVLARVPALRGLLAALALILVTGLAQPAFAQQPNSVNPTASSVKEEQLLNALRDGSAIGGRITIPDHKAATLIQPEGKEWRDFHQTTLRWIGGLAILGMIVALVIFYRTRGKIMIDAGPSRARILRFGTFERFIHWLTAGCFIVLALSGLNITYGKSLLLPIIGPSAFTGLSSFFKLAHNYLAFPFMLGLVLMFLVWVKHNIFNSVDVAWFKAGGGLIGGGHPPAKKFNGGQKMIFWSVILGGAGLSVSGWFLLFPYLAGSVGDLQFWNTVHAVVSVLLISAMLAHAYIGSIGMEGAFDAMGTGEVDLNWAKEHHSLWVEEESRKANGLVPQAVPAE